MNQQKTMFMRKQLCIACLFLIFLNQSAFAWSNKGHRTIVQIAKSHLDPFTIDNVNGYLNGMTWEDAACWMDESSNDKFQQSMKPWQFAFIEKNKTYAKSQQEDLVNKLEYCLRMLELKSLQSNETMNETLKLLFHLIGDIHQPLHCGYPQDAGGKNVTCIYFGKPYTLNQIWETEIIESKNIDIWSCTNLLTSTSFSIKRRTDAEKIDVGFWLTDTRSTLNMVYQYQNNKIDQSYIDNSALITERQMLKAGLRLAKVLKSIFGREY